MFRGAGNSLPRRVDWFLGFSVFGFLMFGLLISWFLGFKASKSYQFVISSFQEDINPLSKILKILLDGSAGLFGARLFDNCYVFWIYKNFRGIKLLF